MSAISEVLFWETEINEIQFMAIFAYAHAEVVRFYITMDVASFVDIFEGTEHLVEQEETCFEGEMFLGHHCF